MWNALVDRETGFRLFNPDVLACIRRCKVLIIGCGGNGNVIDFLVRTGFTRFGLIDPDTVEDTNLNRLSFTRKAIGMAKVQAWKQHIQAVNPDAGVQTWHQGICRHDGPWLEEILRGTGWSDDTDPVDLVFLGTTDVEANLVAGRCCARTHVRTIIGPASSGSWIVGTFMHNKNGIDMETLGGFDTAGIPLENIDYTALRPQYLKALNYPGRENKLQAGVTEAMMKGKLPARSCCIFVRMTNAAMAFEAVKNVADMNGLALDGTSITALPRIQIFDPYSGCSYYYDIQSKSIGIPDWMTGELNWHPWPTAQS